MKAKYLLDTNVCVRYLRGNERIIERMRATPDAEIAISVISVLELLYGAAKARDPKEARADAIALISPWCQLPIQPVLDIYVRERLRLERVGQRVGEFDVLIAATAVAHGLIAVTDNVKHLGRIDGITIENWQR